MMKTEIQHCYADGNAEGVDRKLYAKLAEEYPNVIMFQVVDWPETDEFLGRLKEVQDRTSCLGKCPWLLWWNLKEDRMYIQHGLNQEHVIHIDYREIHSYTLERIRDNVAEIIETWIARVHKHLEKVQDDSREYDWFANPPVYLWQRSNGSFESCPENQGDLH